MTVNRCSGNLDKLDSRSIKMDVIYSFPENVMESIYHFTGEMYLAPTKKPLKHL